MDKQDKKNLTKVAEKFLGMGYYDNKVRDAITADGDIDKDTISYLIKYIAHCQKLSISSHRSEMSIRQMKDQIFNLIGHPIDSRGYGQSTVSKPDLMAIYSFMTQLPTEYFNMNGQQILED